MTQIAVLSDIHGNRWALEAVLADIERRGISIVFNLGDSLYGPLDPSGTADLLCSVNILSVSGNQDRSIIETLQDEKRHDTMQHVIDSLAVAHLNWLRSLKALEKWNEDILLFHGTPGNDETYLLHHVTSGGIVQCPPTQLMLLLEEREEHLFLCGHDHLPAMVRLENGKTIINPGSVGLPAYQDDEPWPHIIENGNPEAVYAVLTGESSEWDAAFVHIPYDYMKASDTASANDRPDWAFWLKYGRAR